jgi:hypothetical protein
MKSSNVWNITLFSPLKVNRRFGGKSRHQFQGPRISRAKKQGKERLSQIKNVGEFQEL